jgi:hypothetical protein
MKLKSKNTPLLQIWELKMNLGTFEVTTNPVSKRRETVICPVWQVENRPFQSETACLGLLLLLASYSVSYLPYFHLVISSLPWE